MKIVGSNDCTSNYASKKTNFGMVTIPLKEKNLSDIYILVDGSKRMEDWFCLDRADGRLSEAAGNAAKLLRETGLEKIEEIRANLRQLMPEVENYIRKLFPEEGEDFIKQRKEKINSLINAEPSFYSPAQGKEDAQLSFREHNNK